MNDVAQSMMEDRRTRAGLGCKRYRCSKLGLGRCPAAFSESMGVRCCGYFLPVMGPKQIARNPMMSSGGRDGGGQCGTLVSASKLRLGHLCFLASKSDTS